MTAVSNHPVAAPSAPGASAQQPAKKPNPTLRIVLGAVVLLAIALLPLLYGKPWGQTYDTYKPPSLDYDFKWVGGPIPGVDWVNKPFVQAVLAAVIAIVFWLVASRNLKTVPSKAQFFFESAYDFIRNGVAVDILGTKNFRRYLPYLLAVFTFILINNLFGVMPPFMYPTFANIGWAWAMALMTWVIYIASGFRAHGLRYLKLQTVPAGTPWWLLPLMIPLEAISNFVVRPITLALRLFGNVLAGHAMVLIFVVGGSFMVQNGANIGIQLAGVISVLFTFAIFAFELFVAGLQAYIFTVLTAVYISTAISEDH